MHLGEFLILINPLISAANCTLDLCGSHGVCYDTVGPRNGFHCDCHDGYYGLTCNYTTNPCVNEDCSGHGHCRVVPDINGIVSALCTCNDYYGFAGNVVQCNIQTRWECLPQSNLCQNGGECRLTATAYTCTCPPSEYKCSLITFRQALTLSL